MNKFVKSSILSSLLLLVSCYAEITDEQHRADETSNEVDYFSIISALGYESDNIIENDSLFVISNIIVLRKEDLRKLADLPPTKISSYPTLLELDKQHIQLCEYEVPDETNSQILTEAVKRWNSVPNCNILFSHGTEYSYEQFYQMGVYISDNPSWIFNTNDPTYQFIQVSPCVAHLQSTATLAINTRHSTWQSYSYDDKVKAMTHALGLLIGLKQNEETDSIMYNRMGSPLWYSFSDTDKSDLMSMYPLTVKSFELSSTVSAYSSDIAYTFTPVINYYKQYTNVEFEYEVQNSSSIVSHKIVRSSNNSAKITFYSAGTYTIICRIRHEDIIFAETSKTVNVISDVCLPDDDSILINQPFSIRWSCSADETLRCSITENIFGNNASDYILNKISPSEYSIKLCDYGDYTIALTKVNSAGQILDSKELHIRRLYRPKLSFPDFTGTLDEFDFRMDVFEVGFICPENTASMIVTSYNPPYNIVVGNGGTLVKRLYLKRFEKFYRNAFFPPEPVCKGPATDINNYVDLTFAKGSSGIIEMPEGRNGYFPKLEGWLNYQGYYAVIIPNDIVKLQSNRE